MTISTALRIAASRAALRGLATTGDPLARLLRPAPHDDVYALHERMRTRGPLHRSRTGIHAVTSHALCSEVLRDPRFRVRDMHGRPADADPLVTDAGGPLSDSFLEQDPPDHTRLVVLTAVAALATPAVRRLA